MEFLRCRRRHRSRRRVVENDVSVRENDVHNVGQSAWFVDYIGRRRQGSLTAELLFGWFGFHQTSKAEAS